MEYARRASFGSETYVWNDEGFLERSTTIDYSVQLNGIASMSISDVSDTVGQSEAAAVVKPRQESCSQIRPHSTPKKENLFKKVLLQNLSAEDNPHCSKFVPPPNWANAPEFVPRTFASSSDNTHQEQGQTTQKSYAQALGITAIFPSPGPERRDQLCPFALKGECRYGLSCIFIHGLRCEFCETFCLHPYKPSQNQEHRKECIRTLELDMEAAFAIQRSSEKTCGICMEVVHEKSLPGDKRFGILPSCNHCFCLACIRRWRRSEFENKIIRSCPECRVKSDFVCPSRYWVETKEEKDELLQTYRTNLSKKPCRYYNAGEGKCPFGNKCFYLHALSNGIVVDVGPPPTRTRRENANGEEPFSAAIWDFLELWDNDWNEYDDFIDYLDSEDDQSSHVSFSEEEFFE